MARFSDNPIKSPLAGNEIGALTDPSTNDDVGFTPATIIQYAQSNMALASGSTNGLMSGAQGDKLNALPAAAKLNTDFAQLAEVAIPVFVGTPANGANSIYTHVCDVPWILAFAYGTIAAGSTVITLTKNGTPIAGFTSGSVGSGSRSTFTGTDSPANMTFNQQDVLGLTLASTTGGAAGLALSIRANATLT